MSISPSLEAGGIVQTQLCVLLAERLSLSSGSSPLSGSLSQSDLGDYDRISYLTFAAHVLFKDQQYQHHLALVEIQDLGPHPRPPESESTFPADP